MSKRPQRRSTPVARAPFNRGAYLHQYALATQATAWLAEHGEDLPLIGSPEIGGRRGSNRSEITPAFMYHAVAALTPADPDEPTVELADGRTLTLSDWQAESADPQIDSVSQHATTAHRDRRLMSGASITRTRYVGACVNRGSEEEPSWQRASVSKAGALVWSPCPLPCPQGCKADHRHTRHQHREAGTLYVHQTAPYGEDGLERTREDGRPVSKRQGRRTRRASMGAWPDAPSYQHEPNAIGVHAVTLPEPAAVEGHNTHVGEAVAMAPADYYVERETFSSSWARPAFVPAKVKADKVGRQRDPILTLGTDGLRKRIARDPELTALAGRVLLAAEHAWTTNGQPVTAEQGLALVVTLPPQGQPTLSILKGDSVLATGTYRARARVVREAVASIIA